MDWSDLDRPTGTVQFVCPSCGEGISEDLMLPAADFTADSGADMTTVEDFSIRCDECEEEFDVTVTAMPYDIRATVSGHPHLQVSVHEFPEEDPGDYDLVDHPMSIFQDAIGTIHAHLSHYTPRPLHSVSFHHMLFMQLFSAFEAFLADHLISIALTDANARARLLTKAKGLSEITVRLIEVERREDLVSTEIKRVLRAISFHDLSKVAGLYDTAAGREFFSSMPPDAKAVIFEAIPKRHDCVHRNGKSTDGVLHLEINDAYVRRVATAMEEVVSYVFGQTDTSTI